LRTIFAFVLLFITAAAVPAFADPTTDFYSAVHQARKEYRQATKEIIMKANPDFQIPDDWLTPVPLVYDILKPVDDAQVVIDIPDIEFDEIAPFDGSACPEENPRFKSFNTSTKVGDPCSYGNVSEGKVFKYKQGTVRNGQDISGTCSCNATACKPGFELENGICKESPEEDNPVTVADPGAEQVRRSGLRFYEVCGIDKDKSGGQEYCIENVFNKTNVQMLQAIGLAKEYALVRNGHTIECSEEYRNVGRVDIDEYIKCTSTDGRIFYEFLFDDIKESVDNRIKYDTFVGVCVHIHGGTRHQSRQFGCITNKPCDALDKSFQNFGYNARSMQYGTRTHCELVDNRINNESELKTAFGIDNFKFYNGMQVRGNVQVVALLKRYAQTRTNVTSFRCNDGFTWYYGRSSIRNPRDDILTCWVNNQQVDFVFDDLSEAWNHIVRGGMSGMECIADNGQYDGKKCWGLNQEQCRRMDAELTSKIPGSGGTRWDEGLQTCVLRDATKAANINKAIEVGTQVAVVAGTTVVIIMSGGTAGAAVGILVAIESAGFVTEQTANIVASRAGDEFLSHSTQCKTATCAERILNEQLRRVSNLSDSFDEAQIQVIDNELARLINLLPENAKIYQDTLAANKADLSWTDMEPVQIIANIGLVMQFAGLITGGVRMVGRAPRMLRNTQNALGRGLKNIGTKLQNNTNLMETANEVYKITELSIGFSQ